MADALDLGSSEITLVWVQLPPLTHLLIRVTIAPMDIKTDKQVKSTAYIKVSVPAKEINQFKNQAITQLASQVTVKGFRQGKAPLKLAQEKIDPQKVNQKILDQVLQQAVVSSIKDNKLDIIGRPKLENLKIDKTPWTFTLAFPLLPEIKLGNYQTSIKAILKKTAKQNRQQQISAIIDSLVKKATFEISPVLIEQEVNYSLNRLAQQAKGLNLELQDYLKAVKKTVDQIKKEYQQQAETTLKGDLILSTIAHQEKITASDKDIEQLAKTANIPPQRQAELEPVIIRQKTIDFLLNL